MQNLRVMQTARRKAPLVNLLVLGVAGLALAGCGGGSIFGAGSPSSTSNSTSFGDRFSQLFGARSQEVSPSGVVAAAQDDDNQLTCPPVNIRPGASTYAVGVAGKEAVGLDLRYQATITRTARSCTLTNGQIHVKVGVQGRVIVGPAGSPSTVDVPIRVAVVQEGVSPKTIATKVWQTNVEMTSESSVVFSLVGEDLVYPAPVGADGDAYVFYVGFDPLALKPEPRARRKRS